jgi:NADH-quinone oxidoreductase subunit J
MHAQLFYAAAAVGAIALFLLMQPRSRPFRAVVTFGGLAAVAMLLTTIARNAPTPTGVTSDGPFWLYVLMALVAVSGAVRMVTHPRPVYAALYFILVIIATAVTFLLMQAEFMAFALLIVYGGAILITYLFVLMLAQQANDRPGSEDAAWYDRTPREPIAAIILGFVVLCATGDALFRNDRALPWVTSPAVVARANVRGWERMEDMPQLILKEASAVAATQGITDVAGLAAEPGTRVLSIDPNGTSATVALKRRDGSTATITLPAEAAPANSRSLGHALVAQFPVSLELAGVILLMAMFGAVVLARKQMELAEDERRIAAGLPRIGSDDAPMSRGGAA